MVVFHALFKLWTGKDKSVKNNGYQIAFHVMIAFESVNGVKRIDVYLNI